MPAHFRSASKAVVPIQGTIINNTGKYIFPGIVVFLPFQYRIEQRNLCGTNIIIRIIFSAANIRLTKNQLIFGKKRSVVSQRDRSDRLHHDRTAQGDAGVVPPFDDELFHPFRRKIERILFLRDAGRGFDSDAEHHGIAVRDTAVDAARPVGSGFSLSVHKTVVMLRTFHSGCGESVAELDAPHRRNRKCQVSQLRFERIEERLAQSDG